MSNTSKRSIVATYYGQTVGEGENAYKPIVGRTRGSNPINVVRNVAHNMANQPFKSAAVVAEVHDEEYGELLLVATYFIGENFQIAFQADVHRPVLITDFPEKGEGA